MSEVIQEINPEIDEMFAKAKTASDAFSQMNAEQISKIWKAIGAAATEKAEFYAEWAVRDTGYGNVEAKIIKKKLASQNQLDAWDPADFITPVIDHEKKFISYPKAAGVVVTLVPVTNPVFGVIGMIMQMVMTRNVLILCPHPNAKIVCQHAIDLFHEVGVANGAPENFIQTLQDISIPNVEKIMHHQGTDLILAVGGPAMVSAAYSSGNPSIGVGAGNCPCYVHETVDVEDLGPRLIYSSSWDNSLPCTTESTALVDASIADAMRASMAAGGGHFITGEDEQKVREVCWPGNDSINPEVIGKSAQFIADKAGITIPEGTISLVIEITSVGKHEWASKEKLWPVFAFKVVSGVDEAISDALAMLDAIGKGHSAAVHSTDQDIITKYGSAMPVGRVSVNGENSFIATGFTSYLADCVMLGTGYWGGCISSENVHPNEFIQWTRLAWSKDADFTPKTL